MAKLKIYTFPDTVLAKTAAPIARVEKSFFKVADDMLETMYCAPGVGLAANQVGILQRIIVIDVEYEFEQPSGGEGGTQTDGNPTATKIITHKKPIILINPEIIHKEGVIEFSEGCLSVPDFTAEVKRSEKLKVQYKDVDGVSRTLDADGLLAVAIQHEIDHLNGKLFIDRLTPLKKEFVKKRLRQERAEREADGITEEELRLLKPKKDKGF